MRPDEAREAWRMPVVRIEFVQAEVAASEEYWRVAHASDSLLAHLNLPVTQVLIERVNVPKASSRLVQDAFLPFATELGFRDEAKGLFADYPSSGLRPDYYMPVGDSGILLEVERGKTTINNMDLLDFWKCHICTSAHYLFLLVPQILIQSETGRVTRPYAAVAKRMASFFVPGNETNVRALHVFGY